jgi:hypothetical protein
MGGGSPFSHSVQNNGFNPSQQSRGFAKKAMMAAGVGAVAGMAVGYGLGRFPRPHFNFRNPEEERNYNSYMYRRYGTNSTDEVDYGRDYAYKPPPRAQTYDSFMATCMKRTDLLQEKTPGPQSDEDLVGIEAIGYPALIDQVKTRICVENYMEYSAAFLKKAEPEQRSDPRPGGRAPQNAGGQQLPASLLMLLCSVFVLH